VGATALAVYGFVPPSTDAGIPLHRKVNIGDLSPTPDAVEKVKSVIPEPVTTNPAVPTNANTNVPRQAANLPSTPKALPDPTYAAGQMPEPSYPKLQKRPDNRAIDRTKSTGPSAEKNRQLLDRSELKVSSATQHHPLFGAQEVKKGRRFTLRMTNPIKSLQGIPDEGGFTVIIPGSLSLDRAGPIAASHPAVKRSMILNKGDHSALTIRFAENASPQYQVTAQDSSLQIIIASNHSSR